MKRIGGTIRAAAWSGTILLAAAAGAVTPPAGHIYDTLALSNLTQGCVATGPGGTFVGIGPSFTANAQAVVLAKESGELRLVAFGFSAIGDCAYDRGADVLYVTDNADNADLGISTGFLGNTGAQSGDTVFAIPAASTASGLSAADVELLPANSVEFAAAVAVDSAGKVFVSNAAGGGAGTVLKIDPAGPSPSTFASGLQFAGGLALSPATGNLFVGENLGVPTFDNRILQFTPAGALVAPVPFAGPSFGFGSLDLAFTDGSLLASGNFGADVVAFDVTTGTSTPFVRGLTFATGTTVDPFTARVEILSSTFTGAPEDRSLHRFTPIDRLGPGRGSPKSECVHEFYGLALTGKDAVCVDGAACDADGKINDSCLFPIGFCFVVADPSFPDCPLPGTVTAVSISTRPQAAAVKETATRIAAALPLGGPSCFFSDGYAVPLAVTRGGERKPGKGQVQVKSVADDGRKDTDVAKLICQPAP